MAAILGDIQGLASSTIESIPVVGGIVAPFQGLIGGVESVGDGLLGGVFGGVLGGGGGGGGGIPWWVWVGGGVAIVFLLK